MTKITNKTPHPYDIHTKDGVKVIDAFGTLEAEFYPAYLDLIKLSFDVEEVTEDREDEQDADLDDSTDDESDDSEDQVEDTDPVDEYDSSKEQADQAEEDQPESEEEAEEQQLEPKAEYEALSGKKPDGRWSEERVLAEIAKLKG